MANSQHLNETTMGPVVLKTFAELTSELITANDEMTDDEIREFFSLDSMMEPIPTATENPPNEIIFNNECSLHRLANVLEIPDYLSFTTNKTFEQMVRQKIYHLTTNPIKIEELGQIAILMHQLNVLNLEKSLWNTYFKSGTSILRLNNLYLKIWPSSVKKMIRSDHRITTISDLDQINVNDTDYLKFVSGHQRELNKKQQQFQQQLNLKKQQYHGFTKTMEDILETFIEEHLQSLHLKYECKIKLVSLDYREQVLEQTFLQQYPNVQQKQIIKRLSYLKYDYEKAKEEVLRMKKQTEHNKWPISINSIQIALPSSIQSLTDTDLRQQLSDRQHRIIQQYKNEMTTLFMDIVEAKLQESQKIFNEEMKKTLLDNRMAPSNQRLSAAMIVVVDLQLPLIAEKVQCIYHYKNATFIS